MKESGDPIRQKNKEWKMILCQALFTGTAWQPKSNNGTLKVCLVFITGTQETVWLVLLSIWIKSVASPLLSFCFTLLWFHEILWSTSCFTQGQVKRKLDWDYWYMQVAEKYAELWKDWKGCPFFTSMYLCKGWFVLDSCFWMRQGLHLKHYSSSWITLDLDT